MAYLRYRLKNMIRGSFGMTRGKPVVYVSHDPEDPAVDIYHRKRILLHSSKGEFYKDGIVRFRDAQRELRILEDEWWKKYRVPPVNIEYPLNRKDVMITPEMFKKMRSNSNRLENETPIRYRGQILRSKNELIAFKALEDMGFNVKTEVTIRGVDGSLLFPDMVFEMEEFGMGAAIEIDGKMENDNYYYKAENRRQTYLRNGFREWEDVLFFRIANGYDFDLEAFIRYVEHLTELNAIRLLQSI